MGKCSGDDRGCGCRKKRGTTKSLVLFLGAWHGQNWRYLCIVAQLQSRRLWLGRSPKTVMFCSNNETFQVRASIKSKLVTSVAFCPLLSLHSRLDGFNESAKGYSFGQNERPWPPGRDAGPSQMCWLLLHRSTTTDSMANSCSKALNMASRNQCVAPLSPPYLPIFSPGRIH